MTTTVNTAPPVVSQDLLNSVNPKPAVVADGSVEADTNKFMTLLVTQLKNQDPLNPLDNAQITSQLAQLSTVTGVNKLNTTLESLKSSYQTSETMAATNMIGKGVLVPGYDIALSSGKAILGVDLATPVDKLQIDITDPRTGKVVQSMDLGKQAAGTVPITWDGVVDPNKLDANGKPVVLKDGKYTFTVSATRAGDKVKDAVALKFDAVNSVTTGGTDGVKLNLTDSTVPMSDIKLIL
jgi:flagellar basal-body rod modification protein FlgD